MKGPATNQWDFGDLFASPPPVPSPSPAPAASPAPATRQVLTVSEVTRRIRELLEGSFGRVWITGEITNLRFQSSGHTYFTLKDAGSQIGCILFRADGGRRKELLQEGRKVNLQGELTVYEPRGQYQLRVMEIELEGLGALQRAFEQLKQRLQAEGLFSTDRKRPLPGLPERIGLLTSPTGAALRDILHVVGRRNKSLELVLVPCRVQGPGAAEEISRALQLLNRWNEQAPSGKKLQLILLARGGGSLEDLWAFNEEVLARAIFNSKLPVMSAIGHEIDFTIADFVADVRAATPSAAAELLTEGAVRACKFVSENGERLRLIVQRRMGREREGLRRLEQGLKRVHPRRWLTENFQRVDDLELTLVRCLKTALKDRRLVFEEFNRRLSRVRPRRSLELRKDQLNELMARFGTAGRDQLASRQQKISELNGSLRLLSPRRVLERGYSITRDAANGKILRSSEHSFPGQKLKTILAEGEISSEVIPSIPDGGSSTSSPPASD